MSARSAALEVLIGCRKKDGWSNALLKEEISREHLEKRDAALATRLAYGVLQNRSLLDFYAKQVLTGKLRDLRPVVRDILHLGLYQIRMMDRIPVSAAVNESVDLCKHYCKKQPHAAPLVNAVLRKASQKADWEEPRDLATKYSHPEGLIALLRSYVGEERLEPMLRANNGAPETVVQVNLLKTDPEALKARLEGEGVTAEDHPWLEGCLVLLGTGSIDHLP